VLNPEVPQPPEIVDVVVDETVCMRFMNCVRIAKRAFKLNPKTGKSSAPGWRNVDAELLWQAGRSCPSGAIRFKTDQGHIIPRWQETERWSLAKHPAAGRPHDQAREPYRGM